MNTCKGCDSKKDFCGGPLVVEVFNGPNKGMWCSLGCKNKHDKRKK